VDLKSTSPLCTYPRHEEYIMNKLWLNGISSILLDGVGDGMWPWCALQKRIPIMCLYDKDIHKKTIEAFLQEKIMKKMEAATPGDARWYRTAAQLGCRENEHDEEAAKAKAAAAAAAKVKAKAAAAKAKAAAGTKRAVEDDEDDEEDEEDEEEDEEEETKAPAASKKKAKKEA
jgi:hypothetical protein